LTTRSQAVARIADRTSS